MNIEVTHSAPADWDSFVYGEPSASHSHLAGWGDVFRRVFGHATRYWTVRDNGGAIIAALPVTLVKTAVFGRHAVSVPFLNYGGPIGRSECFAPLVEHATQQLGAERYTSIQLRCRRIIDIPSDPRVEKVTVVMPLEGDVDAQLKQFTAKLRSQIRRAGKEGAVAGVGPQRLGGFYSVFAEHMRDLGTPAMPRRFFDAVAETFADDIRIGTVVHDGLSIAGGFGFVWREEFEITWASSLVRYKRMAPNMLLYWSLIERCIEEKLAVFNFGRTTPGSGPHQFKLQWSQRQEELPWYEAGGNGDVSRPKKESRSYQLAARVWQRLPLGVANMLGPKIVRGIP
jgi:serine/alanine adding enzyme